MPSKLEENRAKIEELYDQINVLRAENDKIVQKEIKKSLPKPVVNEIKLDFEVTIKENIDNKYPYVSYKTKVEYVGGTYPDDLKVSSKTLKQMENDLNNSLFYLFGVYNTFSERARKHAMELVNEY
jgi:hypothetical protein